MRDEVEAHLCAAGIHPLLVAPAGIGSRELQVILQSTFGEQELALEVVQEIRGVVRAEFATGTQARCIMNVTLYL